MGKHVNRLFILYLLLRLKKEIQNHYNFCGCYYCKRFDNLHKELERWSYYSFNREHNKWFINFHQSNDMQIPLFPVFI